MVVCRTAGFLRCGAGRVLAVRFADLRLAVFFDFDFADFLGFALAAFLVALLKTLRKSWYSRSRLAAFFKAFFKALRDCLAAFFADFKWAFAVLARCLARSA